MKLASFVGGGLMLGCSMLCATAAISIKNGDFESGTDNWKLFIPQESKAAGPLFSVEQIPSHSGQKSAKLTSPQSARFGISYYEPTPITVRVGHHYRLTAWVKAGANFTIEPGTPGVVLRATLFDQNMKDVSGGHVFVGLSGVKRGEATSVPAATVPGDWTKIEGTIEIPAGTSYMVPFIFCWKSSGALWVDDFSVAEVDGAGNVLP